MRRILVTLVAAVAVAALPPTVALARSPSADAFAYEGVFGDLVGYGSTDGTWNKPDGATDTVFSLQLAPLATKDLSALKIDDGSGHYWDTFAGLGWAMGVTRASTHAKHLLNPDETYSKSLDRGLSVYLHIRVDAGWFTTGKVITLTVYYSNSTTKTITTTIP